MSDKRWRFDIGSPVVPGDRLGPARVDFAPGPGTYLRHGQLYASTAGILRQQEITTSAAPATNEEPSTDNPNSSSLPQRSLLSVNPHKKPILSQHVLRTEQLVIARVVRIMQQHQNQVVLEIVATEHGPLSYPHEAVLRREDTWPTQQQTQKGNSSSDDDSTVFFVPGDWIVARILSLGDTRRYSVTTAQVGLGVIYAVSRVSGKPMVPISWNQMECPETGVKEFRKCAKLRVAGNA